MSVPTADDRKRLASIEAIHAANGNCGGEYCHMCEVIARLREAWAHAASCHGCGEECSWDQCAQAHE